MNNYNHALAMTVCQDLIKRTEPFCEHGATYNREAVSLLGDLKRTIAYAELHPTCTSTARSLSYQVAQLKGVLDGGQAAYAVNVAREQEVIKVAWGLTA